MTFPEKQQEILDFIKENCESVDEYVRSLSKVGVKELLVFFGITFDYKCKLTVSTLRHIFKLVLENELKGE